MTKEELINFLQPFTDDIDIHRVTTDKYGEETFDVIISEAIYKFDGTNKARIILK